MAPSADGKHSSTEGDLRKSARSASSAFYWTIAAIVLGGALASQLLWGYLPGSGNYLALTETDHHRRAQALIDQIPPDAAVSAQDRLNPHVSGRETVYIFPRVDDADTVFLDVTGPAWPQHPSDLRQSVDELLAGDFGIAAADDGYLLLQRDAAQRTLPPGFLHGLAVARRAGGDHACRHPLWRRACAARLRRGRRSLRRVGGQPGVARR